MNKRDLPTRVELASPSSWLEQVIYRQIHKEDLKDLEWDGEYLHFRRLFQDIYQNTKQGKAIMWGAYINEVGLIAQAFVQLISARMEMAEGKKRAYIHAFRVKPPYRGAGLGSRMLKFVERDLSRRGFQFVTLNVAKINFSARRFYERHGYRVVADEAGRWSYLDHEGRQQNVVEPSWRMQKTIQGKLTIG